MFEFPPFSLSRLPRIEFGPGVTGKLPALAASYGKHALILTGRKSFVDSQHWHNLQKYFRQTGVGITHIRREAGEPTPEQLDDKIVALAGEKIDVVIGIGGGSVLDEAKALAGLLKPGASVMKHLEGVGPELPYMGPAIPFIAVPTTAGTGSEATKNAVLSRHGPDGFKRSFRDDKLVAQWAMVDPDLLATCPRELIAGNGMDAFTQLLESYVSPKSSPVTDSLAMRGLKSIREGMAELYNSEGANASARYHMALAALLSGICLSHTGLGSVHALASPLGAYFRIPHGVACGMLVGAATRVNIAALSERQDKNSPGIIKYWEVGQMMSDNQALDKYSSLIYLGETINRWTDLLDMPRLQSYGVEKEDFPHIIANIRPSSMETNPVTLQEDEIGQILQMRL